ncbi:MAG: C40 family peptidase [Lachnospiraceae bacterium]|nr:C40 family peptidase [Lachnospiraceae bacterium]
MKKSNIINSKILAGVLAAAVVVVGAGTMSLNENKVMAAERNAKAEETRVLVEEIGLPSAGVGQVVDNYVGASGDSSVELLSTTALAAGYEEFNEYYDGRGNCVGKLIVCKEDAAVNVYDRIPGNERIETGDTQMAKIVGRMYYGDTATLIMECGFWYEIVADTFSGYVPKEHFVTGKEAEKLNDDTWERIAIIGEDDLYINEEPWYGSTVLCCLDKGMKCPIVEWGDEFSLIHVDGVGDGWVENALCTITDMRKVGITAKEEAKNREKIEDGVDRAAAIEEAKEAYTSSPAYQFAHIEPAPADTADTAAFRQAVADYAQQFVGWLPYVWGGNSLESGADCCGFTQAIYAAFGIDIPRTEGDQYWSGTQVSLDDLRPGDIIYYGGHVALFVGGDTVVHEPVPGDVCSYQSVYMMDPIGAVRYIN